MTLEELKKKVEDEYEIPRIGSDHIDWLKSIADEIKQTPGAAEQVRIKSKPFKRLVEEAIPIAYFANWHPNFVRRKVVMRSGYQQFDAETECQNSAGKEFIEIVNAEDGYLFSLRMQIMNKFGWAQTLSKDRIPFYKEVLEGAKTLSWLPDIVHGRSEFQSSVDNLEEVLRKKLNKKYVGSYHLVAAFDLDLMFSDLQEIVLSLRGAKLPDSIFKSVTVFERRSKKLASVFPLK